MKDSGAASLVFVLLILPWFVPPTSCPAGDWRNEADSYELELVQEGDSLATRTALVRLYLDHRQNEQALKHVRIAISALPNDAAVHATYAAYLEELGLEKDALQLWKSALEIDPRMEIAHRGMARILLNQGDLPGAVQAADSGLEADSKSARLYLTKALAQERQNRWYDARRTIAEGVAAVEDLRLLRHSAEIEDQYGRSAVRSYAALAAALERSQTTLGEYRSVLERGFDISLRVGDLRGAEWFLGKLKAIGVSGLSGELGDRSEAPRKGVWIPGGMRALLLAMQAEGQATPERSLIEYCRIIIALASASDAKTARSNLDLIDEYFRRIAALEALGKRHENRVTIRLSVDDNPSWQATEKVLHLLGWEIRNSGEKVIVEVGEKKSVSRNQTMAPALNIDQLAMQEALRKGGRFDFEIADEWVPVRFDESVWRARLYPKEDPPGGLLQAMERDPQIARLYLGLNPLDDTTASLIVDAVGLEPLAQKYGDLILAYSSALAVRRGKAAVPGGEQAEPLWERMVGEAPRDAGRFFKALLQKDEGKLLAFYFSLAEQDMLHQRFFTQSSGRMTRFYGLFRDAPEVRFGAGRKWRDTPFVDFFGNVPLDDNGHVKFPGGPEVWMVARGQSGSPEATAKLIKKLAGTVAPDVEDEILLRVARTAYKREFSMHSELNNFLAVAHLDAHRSEPIGPEAALMLAQEFAKYASAWPYFAILTGLERNEYAQFFALGSKLQQYHGEEANRILGQVHSLIKLICLAKQADRITESQSTGLFALLCARFSQAVSARDYTAASLAVVRALIAKALPGESPADPDAALEEILLGGKASVSLEGKGTAPEWNGGRMRLENYRRVLELQKVPALRTLFELHDAAQILAGAGGDLRKAVRDIERAAASMPNLEIPETLKIRWQEADCLESFQTRKITKLVVRLRQTADYTKTDSKDLIRLSAELLAAMNPQTELALAGVVYAYYLKPSDLLVEEDPLFLRRHQFVGLLSESVKTERFVDSELVQWQGNGSFLRGGFADFEIGAGETALAGSRIADVKSYSYSAVQVGILRATRWDFLQDDDLRLAGLKIRAAREWIVRAARDPGLMSDLAEASCGILSLNRRAELLRSLESKDWSSVWSAVTLSDLFFLSDEYLTRYRQDPWESPTMKALRLLTVQRGSATLQWLGPVLGSLFNCSHPHLLRLPPYEHFEQFLRPDRMAVRVGEFKLYLSEYLDELGSSAGVLDAIAEPAAMEILREVRLSDLQDWQALIAAYSRLNDSLVQGVLERQ